MDIVENIIKYAVSRANHIRAIESARGCDDREWLEDNRNVLPEYDSKMNELLAVATPEQIRQAKDRTNAPIY